MFFCGENKCVTFGCSWISWNLIVIHYFLFCEIVATEKRKSINYRLCFKLLANYENKNQFKQINKST